MDLLKGKVVPALGPDSEIKELDVGWPAVTVEGLRIKGSQGWPAPDREHGRVAIADAWDD